MSRLLTLDGQPMTWPELHRRRECYYAQFVTVRVSGNCGSAHHRDCNGLMAAEAGKRGGVRDRVPCPCACHIVSAVSA